MRMVNDKLPQDNSNPPSIPDYDQSELRINIQLVDDGKDLQHENASKYIRYIRSRYSRIAPNLHNVSPATSGARGYPLDPLGLGDYPDLVMN